MAILIGASYLVIGPQLVDTFLRKTGPGKLIMQKTKLGCDSNPNPVFTKDITDLNTIRLIVPPGEIVKSADKNVFKSHSFLVSNGKSPIYAPVDSKLTEGSAYIEEGIVQYLMFFDVSCEVYYKVDHVQELSDKAKTLFVNDNPTSDSRTRNFDNSMEFKAGELIGYTSGTVHAETWDFGVYNNTVSRVYPPEVENLNLSEMDYEAVCPYDFFVPTKQQVYKNLFGNLSSGDISKLICN